MHPLVLQMGTVAVDFNKILRVMGMTKVVTRVTHKEITRVTHKEITRVNPPHRTTRQ
jgi:hypothetical protein